MEYFITAFFIVVFVYIVVKQKVVPAVRGKGYMKHGKESAGVPGSCGSHAPPAVSGFTYFDVLVFSRDVEESDSAFAERISLHLARSAGEINGKGYAFRTSYIPLSGTLIVLLSWRV